MKFILIIALFCFSSVLLAETKILMSPACSCKTLPPNPFEEPIQINFGNFKGLCIDACKHQPARFFSHSPDLALFKKSEDEVVITNFHHLKKYWIAVIPMDAVTSAGVDFEEFQPGITHMTTRFNFSHDRPIRLYNSHYTNNPKPEYLIYSLMSSVEGIPASDKKYNLIDGAMGRYLLGHRIVSAQEMKNWVIELKHPTTQYKLNVSQKEAEVMLMRALTTANDIGFRTDYRLFDRNCATEATNLMANLNTSNQEDSSYRNFERGIPLLYFYGTINYLKKKKLLAPENQIINLEKEIL